MKSAKFFIVFTFLLAFALSVSAQDEKPMIVWKNLQEKYKNFEDIKPGIRNNFDKPIYLYPTLKVEVLVFDDETKKWDLSKYIFVTDYHGYKLPKRKSIKLNPNETIDISSWVYWNYALLGEHGAFQPYNKPDWDKMPDYITGRKYKLKILYSEKKYKNPVESESSEFWVKPREETK